MADKNSMKLIDVNDNYIFDIDADDLMIVSHLDTVEIFHDKFSEWTFEGVKRGDEDAEGTLIRVFTRWKNRNAENFKRIYQAFTNKYNPLENYDRYEEGGWKDTGTVNRTSNGTTEGTNSLTNEGTDTGKVSAFNSEQFQDSTQNVSTSETTGANSTTINGSEEGTSENVHEFVNYHIHGNIGTTKSTDMFLDEVSARKKDMAFEIVSQFVLMYCYLKDEE